MFPQNNVDSFINDVVNGNLVEVDYQQDEEFMRKVRLNSVLKIEALLYNLNSNQIHCEKTGTIFHLSDNINEEHPSTGINLIEYCLVAGLDNLALRIAFLGGHTENIENLKEYCNSFTDKSRLDTNMLRTLRNVDMGALQAVNHGIIKDKTRLQKAVSNVKKHKVALFLATTGVAALIAAPFTGGASEVLFAIGVSATISSAGSYQSGSALRASFSHVESQSRVWYEAGEIKNLMDIASKTKMKLESDVKREKHILEKPKAKILNIPINNSIRKKIKLSI